jgi:hypothetical protein
MSRLIARLSWLACCGAICLTTQRAWSQTPLAPPRGALNQAPLNPASATPPPPPAPVFGQGQAPVQPSTSPPASDVIEPLLRGPLHEGFAEAVQLTPQPTRPVPGQPPEAINEAPADIRPDNPDAEWVPGYWGWNPEGKQFIWVSGTWRVPPPGSRWIPGYWTTGAAGAERVPGFWLPAETSQLTYLPAPPAYQDEGVDPSSPPSPDVFWVPGNWAFVNGNFAWEPGYWARIVPGWMWIAAHYVWTPYGYIFVDGYWDYPLDERGELFTPVAFQAPVWQQPGFVYTPDYLLDVPMVADNLFVAPSFGDYYFGDYYGNQYEAAGIYPWYAVGTGSYLYDPIFAYRSWVERRRNPHWRDGLRQRYARLVRNPAARPPRTWREEQRLMRSGSHYRPFAMRAAQALGENGLGQHYVRMNAAERRTVRQNTEMRRRLAIDRSRMERRAPGTPARPEARLNALAPARTFRLPPVHNLTRSASEGRERAIPNPAINRGPELRGEQRPNVVERRVAPRVENRPAPRVEGNRGAEARRAQPRVRPPRRPERVSAPRPAPAARRPAPARPEKKP